MRKWKKINGIAAANKNFLAAAIIIVAIIIVAEVSYNAYIGRGYANTIHYKIFFLPMLLEKQDFIGDFPKHDVSPKVAKNIY